MVWHARMRPSQSEPLLRSLLLWFNRDDPAPEEAVLDLLQQLAARDASHPTCPLTFFTACPGHSSQSTRACGSRSSPVHHGRRPLARPVRALNGRVAAAQVRGDAASKLRELGAPAFFRDMRNDWYPPLHTHTTPRHARR